MDKSLERRREASGQEMRRDSPAFCLEDSDGQAVPGTDKKWGGV